MWIPVSDRLPFIDPQTKVSRFVPVTLKDGQESWGRAEERLGGSTYWHAPLAVSFGELPAVVAWYDLPPWIDNRKEQKMDHDNLMNEEQAREWAKAYGVDIAFTDATEDKPARIRLSRDGQEVLTDLPKGLEDVAIARAVADMKAKIPWVHPFSPQK